MRLGKPEGNDLAAYASVPADGIDIYCHADIEKMAGSGDLTVEVEQTFFSKKLVLYGIKMDKH